VTWHLQQKLIFTQSRLSTSRARCCKEGERSTSNEKHFAGHGGLFVNIQKNRWYSHGNQAGGDAVDLIRHVKQCEFHAARQWLS
jgi:hypothetical protein